MTTTTIQTGTITLTLEQLRALSKSVSKTKDAELRKLERLKPGALRSETKREFDLIDSVDSEIAEAIAELVEGL